MTRIASGSEFCCYICNEKTPLEKDRINIHTHVPTPGKLTIPERISYLMNDDYYIVITDDDVICKRCSSLLNHLERVENERLLVVKALVGYLNSKYELDISAESSDLIQGKRCTNKERKIELIKKNVEDDKIAKPDVPKPVPEVPPEVPQINDTVGDEVTQNAPSTPPKTSPIMPRRQTRTPNRTVQTPKAKLQDATKMKIYKCGFCSFQSKELNHVRMHMKVHVDGKKDGGNIDGEKPPKIVDKGPVRRRVFRCQVCSQSFTDRDKCLEHISRLHSAFGVAKSKLNDKKSESCASETNEVNQVAESNNSIADTNESMPEIPVLEPKKEATEVPEGEELPELEEEMKKEDEKSEMEVDEIRMSNNSEPEVDQKIENDEEEREPQVDENVQKEENVNGLETDVNMETDETDEGQVDTKLLFGCDVCEVSYNNQADFIDHAKLHVMKIEEQRNALSVMQDDSEIGDKLQHMPEITAERIGGGNVAETEVDLESMVASLHYNELNGVATEEDTTIG